MILLGFSVAAAVWLGGRPQIPVSPQVRWLLPPLAIWAAIGVAAGIALTWLAGRALVLALVVLALLASSHWFARRRGRARRAEHARANVLLLFEALAAELNAGLPHQVAITRVSAEFPEFVELSAAIDFGADIPDLLRRLARQPGAEDLRLLAAGWQVAQRSGSSLAGVVTGLLGGLTQHETTARLVSAELASTRATAVIMALLPFAALLMGSSLGGDPLGFLLDTTAGSLCLAAGLALEILGLAWLDLITSKAVAR